MDIDTFIHEAIFGEKEQHRIFYYLMWENLQEVGYVITDESGYEIDSVFKAVALQNLVGEFAYRLYDTVNETGYEDVLEYLGTLAIGEDDILQYCENDPEILVEPEDFELTVKNALDTITERTADKLLEEFSADDLLTTCLPPLMTLSKTLPTSLRTRTNFRPLWTPTQTSWTTIKRNTRLLCAGWKAVWSAERMTNIYTKRDLDSGPFCFVSSVIYCSCFHCRLCSRQRVAAGQSRPSRQTWRRSCAPFLPWYNHCCNNR